VLPDWHGRWRTADGIARISARRGGWLAVGSESFHDEGAVRLTRVVVGTDFTDASVWAARWVARHLDVADEIVLFHAIDLPQPPAFLRGLLPTPESVSHLLQYGAEHRLQELAATLGTDRVQIELRSGSPVDALLDYVREAPADLLVVGDHGARRGMWNMLGSTTARLVRASTVPVLVGRALGDEPPASILAPLDASPIATDVLEWTRRLQLHFGSRVTACYAVDVMQAYGRIRTVSAATRAAELERELRARSGEWIRQRLNEAGFGPEDAAIEVMVGDPRTVIPVMAEHADARLIVIGSSGAGTMGRTVLGSVADAVLSSTSYPVLVVPGRAEARPG
jgi:nucleotide-binding universal stress UspA family protein